MQPATIVEDTGFQLLVHLLDSRYQLPSRRHIMRSLLPDMYTTRAGEIKRELLQISHVALTSDLWTSRTTESYLTITCHFVTSTWELKSLVLETFGFKKDRTTENIAASFQKNCTRMGNFPKSCCDSCWQCCQRCCQCQTHWLDTCPLLCTHPESSGFWGNWGWHKDSSAQKELQGHCELFPPQR